MTLMGITLIICGVALSFCTYLLLRWWVTHRHRIRRRENLKRTIAAEVDELVRRIETVAKKAEEVQDAGTNFLQSSKYLTTLLTVLIKKFDGAVCLTEGDFLDCGVDDYVTVYYQEENNSLILQLNTILPLMSDVKDDEPTFH